MHFLLASIILTSYLTLAFKVCERLRISSYQAIIFNYITCVLTGTLLNGSFPVVPQNFNLNWFKWSILMGAMFISIFNVVAITTRKAGVAVASVANKLSMVIPATASVFLYNDKMNFIKILGILLALLAVILTSFKKNEPHEKTSRSLMIMLVVMLFISSGLLDTLIKYVEFNFLNESNKNDYLISAFFFAAFIGTVLLSIQLILRYQTLQLKAIIAGIAIGIPNYFSIWFLIKVLKNPPMNLQSSAIIPVNNMGIVLFSSVVAFILFKEKLLRINWFGIVLSLLAIFLIAYGDILK